MTTISIPTLQSLCEKKARWISLANEVKELHKVKNINYNHSDYWLDFIETTIRHNPGTYYRFVVPDQPQNTDVPSVPQKSAKRVISELETGFNVDVNKFNIYIRSFTVSHKDTFEPRNIYTPTKTISFTLPLLIAYQSVLEYKTLLSRS